MVSTKTWLGRYQLGPEIGAGGFKRIYRAIEKSTQTPVAFAHLAEVDPAAFREEVALVSRISPEFVAGIRDSHLDQASGHGYIVFELCEGPTLLKLIQDRGAIPLYQALPLMFAFARSLEAVHAAKVLHRDIKPENVILSPKGTKLALSILDFGLALRATDYCTNAGANPLAGTLSYLSPEAVRGEALDARTDVYALGVCFYEILVGSELLQRTGRFIEDLRSIAELDAHELLALAPFPAPLRALITAMVSADIEARPYMPKVRATLAALLEKEDAAEDPTPRPKLQRADPLWAMEWSVPIPGLRPHQVMPAPCGFAPVIAWSGQRVWALTREGATRWSVELDFEIRAGIRADLDRDGVREIYLVGAERWAALDARGELRFVQPLERPSLPGTPSLLVLQSQQLARLAIDGILYDSYGKPKIPIPLALEGDGDRLVDASPGRGLSYNGLASQSFRGQSYTPAAIVHAPGAPGFHVAHLERSRGSLRVQLSVYGPGGRRRARFVVADAALATGDVKTRRRLASPHQHLFGPEQAPLAIVRGEEDAILIVPFLGPPKPLPSCLVAFSLGREAELWRQPMAAGSAILGDADGDGRPELIVGDGQRVLALSPDDGRAVAEQQAPGLPAALGDPFGAGRTFLFTTSSDGLDVLRGAPCLPGRMQWVGPRGDQWGSGALRPDGQPFGAL